MITHKAADLRNWRSIVSVWGTVHLPPSWQRWITNGQDTWVGWGGCPDITRNKADANGQWRDMSAVAHTEQPRALTVTPGSGRVDRYSSPWSCAPAWLCSENQSAQLSETNLSRQPGYGETLPKGLHTLLPPILRTTQTEKHSVSAILWLKKSFGCHSSENVFILAFLCW